MKFWMALIISVSSLSWAQTTKNIRVEIPGNPLKFSCVHPTVGPSNCNSMTLHFFHTLDSIDRWVVENITTAPENHFSRKRSQKPTKWEVQETIHQNQKTILELIPEFEDFENRENSLILFTGDTAGKYVNRIRFSAFQNEKDIQPVEVLEIEIPFELAWKSI